MRATSTHLQIQGRSAKLIFILQMHRNIVSLNKRFGRQCFKSAQVLAAKRYVSAVDKCQETQLRHQSSIFIQVYRRQLHKQIIL